MRSCQNTCFEHFCGSVFFEKSSQIAGNKHRKWCANLMARRIFVHRRGASRGVLCLSFSNEARSAFLFVKQRVFSTVPSPQVAHAPPGGPQITPVCSIFLVFSKGFCDFAENPSPLSSKMPIGGPAARKVNKSMHFTVEQICAFTTLKQNDRFRASGGKNCHSVREW